MSDRTITPMKTMQASVNWVFHKPTISNDVYNETVVAPDVPTTIGNYVGRNISALQAWAQGLGITVNVSKVQDSSQANGTIIYQDIPEGTPIGSIDSINVTVVDNTGNAEATPTPTATAEEVAQVQAQLVASSKKLEEVPSPTPAPTPTPTPAPTPAPTPEPTPTPTPEASPSPTAEGGTPRSR